MRWIPGIMFGRIFVFIYYAIPSFTIAYYHTLYYTYNMSYYTIRILMVLCGLFSGALKRHNPAPDHHGAPEGVVEAQTRMLAALRDLKEPSMDASLKPHRSYIYIYIYIYIRTQYIPIYTYI